MAMSGTDKSGSYAASYEASASGTWDISTYTPSNQSTQ